MKKAYIVTIKGDVTGVGFRYSALRKAEEYSSLEGYIRNVAYGHVEAFIQGDEKETALMLGWLRHGPRFSTVETFEYKEAPLENNLTGFKII